MKVIQINMDGKSYFCQNGDEKRIFRHNHPGKELECFSFDAEGRALMPRIKDPENAKHFVPGATNL